MARTTSLQNMSVEELLNLQKSVNATLSDRRFDIERQLRQLGTLTDGVRITRGRRGVSALKGIKVAPKYRLGSQTWAGRGARPRWLVAAMKESGQKLSDFLIEKGTKKRRAKR
jgi:DNA-binding protein H-NS